MYNEPAYTHHLDSTFTQILLHLFHLFLLFVFAVSAEAQDFKANLGLHVSNIILTCFGVHLRKTWTFSFRTMMSLVYQENLTIIPCYHLFTYIHNPPAVSKLSFPTCLMMA